MGYMLFNIYGCGILVGESALARVLAGATGAVRGAVVPADVYRSVVGDEARSGRAELCTLAWGVLGFTGRPHWGIF